MENFNSILELCIIVAIVVYVSMLHKKVSKLEEQINETKAD